MRIRSMRTEDLDGVIKVYEARTRVSVGLLRRDRERWKMFRGMKETRRLWVVAEDRGRIVGYGFGAYGSGSADMGDVFWLPEYDGSALPFKIRDELLRRLRSRKPAMVNIWGMSGSLLLSLGVPPGFMILDAVGIFMAGVTDAGLLLRDAKRIIGKRVRGSLKITVKGRSVRIGRGGDNVHVVMDADVLLGLLLGLRELTKDVNLGAVTFSPQARGAVKVLESAFPPCKFWIEDGW